MAFFGLEWYAISWERLTVDLILGMILGLILIIIANVRRINRQSRLKAACRVWHNEVKRKDL
jgi:uncharacterized membrane-anchored protein YhcB (DUF1043 family)